MNRIAGICKFKAWVVSPLFLMVIWFYPHIALAQEAPPSESTGSPGGDLLMIGLKIVLSVLSLLGSILVGKAISYFEKKTKIDIPASTEKMLFDWADQAIGLAHEKGHQLLQKEGRVLGGNEKLNIALQFVLDIATKHNLEGIAEDKLKDYINAKLGQKRLTENGIAPAIPDTVVIAK